MKNQGVASLFSAANSSEQEYPQDEWRIAGELIRQIAKATTWQRIIEAGDALMTVSRIARSMRDERDHHAKAEASRTPEQEWLCQVGHKWRGRIDSCCPECGRRPSTHASHSLQSVREDFRDSP